jgi:hypothetical protein
LFKANAYEQRTYQAGADSNCDAVDVARLHLRALKRFFDDRHDLVEVFARRELRDNAAEAFVNVDLRGDNGGDNLASIAHHCGCGFIARGFNTENKHDWILTMIAVSCDRALMID